MVSLYVLHKDGALVRAVLEEIAFIDKKDAEFKAAKYGCKVVEFREVAGDTVAGALAAAEATIARLMQELEQLRNRPSTHELAKRYLEATEG